MMHYLWLKKLALIYSEDIFDIVQFGSSLTEEKTPNDIDIVVIFKKSSLKDQLIESQKIKEQLQTHTDLPIHIKSFDFPSLLAPENFAKESIFLGISLISCNYFSQKFGLTPRFQVSYDLHNLVKKEKVKFNYLLNGKGGKYGLLKKYGGELIAPGLIEISPERVYLFENEMKNSCKELKIKKIFVQI